MKCSLHVRWHLVVAAAVCLAATQSATAQIVFSNDFEADTAGFTAGGSLSSLTRVLLPTDSGGPSSPNKSMWLGKLGDGVPKSPSSDEIVTLPLSGLVPGQTYAVQFDLLIGASWDGAAGGYGPDSWRFAVNGTRLVDTIFSNVQQGVDAGAYSPQRYTDTAYSSPNGPDVPRFTGAEASYYTVPGYADDYAIYSFGHGNGNPILRFRATAATATLEFARYGNTFDSADEYWALDNVRVTGTPAPIAVATSGTTAIPGGTGTFTGFGAHPAISAGKLASYGAGAGGQQGIYLMPQGPPNKLVDLNTAIPGGTGNFTGFGVNGIPGDPCISGDNVAFFGVGSGGQQGLYRATPSGPPIKVADLNTAIPGGTGNFTGFSNGAHPPNPCISGDTLAFYGTGSGGQQGVYRAIPQGPPIKVADLNTAIPGGTGNFTGFGNGLIPPDPIISGDTVAFLGVGSGGQQGVYAMPQGPPNKVADLNTAIPSGSGNFTSFSSLALDPANATNIAIIGSGATSSGIYVSAGGGALKRAVDTTMNLPGSTATFASFKSVSIDPTDIAFQATGSGGQEGIFAELRGSLIDIVNVNDVVAGKTIAQLDLGQFAFGLTAGFPTVTYRATFGDSSSGIFTATLPPLTGDFDRDGSLTVADLQTMLTALRDLDAYKTVRNLTDADLLAIGDLDGDESVTNKDIQSLLDTLANGGGSGSIAAVPEPVSVILLAAGGLFVLGQRRCRRPR